MSKRRILDTKFWKDGYVANLDPSEKLLFLYILTGPISGFCGICELSLREISFDTGLEAAAVQTILRRFEDDKKVVYGQGWICIVNHPKYLFNLTTAHKKGLVNELQNVPQELLNRLPNEYFDSLRALGIVVEKTPNSIPTPSPLDGDTVPTERITSTSTSTFTFTNPPIRGVQGGGKTTANKPPPRNTQRAKPDWNHPNRNSPFVGRTL